MNPNKKNTPKQMIKSEQTKTTNKEGGLAFTMSNKLKLYSMVASWLVGEPKFYADTDEDGVTQPNQDQQIINLIHTVLNEDPEFVLKLAIYAREKLYLRTAPQVLLVEASLARKQINLRNYTHSIVQRADELCTCVGYLQSLKGNLGDMSDTGSMPASLKRGLADKFHAFNDYQLQKYNNPHRMVKLRDVLQLTHPKPRNDEQAKLWKQLLENKMPVPKTWETIVTERGSNTEAWNQAITVMPFMAMLRNLRNLIEHKCDMTRPLEMLNNKEHVLKSKQFPFRFFSAHKMIKNIASFDTQNVLAALETALEYSVENVPRLKGTTMITADNSASMRCDISSRSIVRHEDIANLFLSMANSICDKAICSIFGDTLAIKPMTRKNILANMGTIVNDEVGSSTNAFLAIDYLTHNKLKADRFILISDMQCYNSTGWQDKSVYQSVIEYRRKVNPDMKFYSIDTSGYGTLQIPENDPNTCLIAGWSDKILNYIPVFEATGQNAVDEIERIKV